MNDRIRFVQGSTEPWVVVPLYKDGTYYSLVGASVVMQVAATVGGQYFSYALPGTWASSAGPTVSFPINPSALAPSGYPAASAGIYSAEVWARSPAGGITQWPSDEALRFVVRKGI